MKIFAVYTPTLSGDQSTETNFTIDCNRRGDTLIEAGDRNAHAEPSDNGNRYLIGKFRFGERCENGARLLHFADTNKVGV